VLYQFGILGKLYAENVLGISNPKVGLLNIGEEEEKGNLLTQATHQLMKDSTDFNFVGNVEGTRFI
jgi:phosphate acyltransferase